MSPKNNTTMNHLQDDRHWMRAELRDAPAAQAATWEKQGHSLSDPWQDPERPDRQWRPLGRLAWLWLTAPEGFVAKNTSLASRLLRAASTTRSGTHESVPGVPDAALMWLALHRQAPGQAREVDRAAGLLYRIQSPRGTGEPGDGGWLDAALSWMEKAIDRGEVPAQASFPVARRIADGCLKHVSSPHRVWGNPRRERWTPDHSCRLLQRVLMMCSKAPNAWEVLSSVYGLAEPCYKMLAEGSTTRRFRECMREWAGKMVQASVQPGHATRLDPALLSACMSWPDTQVPEHMDQLRQCPEVVEHARLSAPWLYSHLTTTTSAPACRTQREHPMAA